MATSARRSRRPQAAALPALLAGVARGAALGACPPRAALPAAPRYATDLNGVAWPDYCFEQRELEEHFFIIGDWGGVFQGPGLEPQTAQTGRAPTVPGIDDRAQLLVAEQMNKRASISQPRYVLNVGDNFYWGGVNLRCGESAESVHPSTMAQWQAVFEDIYNGSHLVGRPWLGVLGNHDYGGFMFTQGWDQSIAYTWGPSGRWVTPAQYWSTTVRYSDFSVDYIFVDSNMNDAMAPMADPGHNMCSEKNNPPNATCGITGPSSTEDCVRWFYSLWDEQIPWMESRLNASEADWRVIVTHFPPDYYRDVWARLAEKYGVDLIVSGHRHHQELSGNDPSVGNAAWVISGGGGGILAEATPREDGDDDAYGFMDVTISKSEMRIESISHSGIVRKTVTLQPRRPLTPLTPPTTTTATATTTASNLTTATSAPAAHQDRFEGTEFSDEILQLSGTQQGPVVGRGLSCALTALAACVALQ